MSTCLELFPALGLENRVNWMLIFTFLYSCHSVTYWPRPSCQNRKCTCVSGRGISGYNLDRGWVELSAICDAHKKKVVVEQLYNPGEDRKSVGDKMLEWRPYPREAVPRLSSPGERERNAVMAIRVGVNMLQLCSASNSPLTQ